MVSEKKHAALPPDQALQEYKDTLQRLQAEFENYKKRTEKEVAEATAGGKRQCITALLPIVDSFELALKNSGDADKFKTGIELLYAQFRALLEAEGLRKIDALGKPLDPYLHEVLMREPSDRDNVVLEEFQPGYRLGDTVIRHSRVKVGVKQDAGNQ